MWEGCEMADKHFVYNYDLDDYAFCPLTSDQCVMTCELMRPTGFGEPRCSLRVVADELVYISTNLREIKKDLSQWKIGR